MRGWRRRLVGLAGFLMFSWPAVRVLAASWVVADARTGAILAEADGDRVAAGGAAVHLLILLSAFEQAKLGILPLDVPVSVDAQSLAELAGRRTEPVRLSGQRTYLLSDLLKAVFLTRSDLAAVAAAEAMWGSRETAIEALNERAARLGLHATRVVTLFREDPSNTTTPHDLARLGHVLLQDCAEVRRWGQLRGIPFDDGRLVLGNQHLAPAVPGTWAFFDRFAEPKKKKVLQRAGILLREENGLELLGVWLGEDEVAAALSELVGVLQDILARYEPVSMVRAGDPLKIAVTVEGGTEPAIVPIAAEDVRIAVPKGTETQVELLMQVPSVVTAPVARGEQLGEVVVRLGGRVVAVVPAVSPKTVGSRGVRSAEVQLPKRTGVGVQ